ncbi:site-2 protease family protein [candidate division KSB1 bacterium]|nr:site-2 protease family protein [candidate division KSB1 bacterium]
MLPRKNRVSLHLLLFLLTILTTYWIGSVNGSIGALWYSGGLMSILLFHEAGHYFAARRHRVSTSLPYFIPMPLPPFGTMGAVIKMDGHIPNRRALMDIGAAGPFAGLVVAIPAIFFGLKLSQIIPLEKAGESTISLGDSLLFSLLTRFSLGAIPEGQDILLHPLAFAGWVGLLITAINLLPVGQLDGGHILYALFNRKSRFVAWILYGVFLYVCLFHYFGWFLLLVLLAIFRKHPPTMQDSIPLDPIRKIAGVLALILFVLAFTPVPFGFGEGLIPLLQKLITGQGL